MLAMATSQVLAPVIAGFLLLAVGIDGIILIDCASYAFALLGLAIVRIPHTGGERATPAGLGSLLADFAEAWRYVAARRGLVALMLFLGALNFFAGFADLLITPLVLAFASSDALGTVMSIGGLGMIAASLVVSAWGGPRHRVRGVLGFSLVIGLAMVLGALRPNTVLITVGAALLLASLAVVISCNQAIWQTKVEPAMLGRTMALLNMVASAPQLVAYAVAGALTDLVFQPLVGRDEVRHPVLAVLVGTGPGRGIALLLMVMGVLIIVVVALAWGNPRLRRLEEELPDMTDEAPEPAAVSPGGTP
jgi:MFS family permease